MDRWGGWRQSGSEFDSNLTDTFISLFAGACARQNCVFFARVYPNAIGRLKLQNTKSINSCRLCNNYCFRQAVMTFLHRFYFSLHICNARLTL